MQTYLKIGTTFFLIAMGVWMFGCSGSDGPLDENTSSWAVSVMSYDGEENMETIDVVQTICDITEEVDDNGTVTEVTIEWEEGLFPWGIEVTMTASSDVTADLQVESYEVELFPARGVYVDFLTGLETEIYPVPEIPSEPTPYGQLNRIHNSITPPLLRPGGTLTFSIRMWVGQLKRYWEENVLRMDYGFNGELGWYLPYVSWPESKSCSIEYDYKVTLHCVTNGDEDKNLEAWGSVVFGDFSRCD